MIHTTLRGYGKGHTHSFTIHFIQCEPFTIILYLKVPFIRRKKRTKFFGKSVERPSYGADNTGITYTIGIRKLCTACCSVPYILSRVYCVSSITFLSTSTTYTTNNMGENSCIEIFYLKKKKEGKFKSF